MKFKGTKGEWHVVEYPGFVRVQDGPYYEDDDLLDYDSNGKSKEEVLANAQLISKAPEMLEMLKVARDKFLDLKYDFGMDCQEIQEELEGLIKEATEQ